MIIPNLTIHMMLKNEERYIQQTLRSTLGHAENAIIIDTGSTDNTVAMVEDMISGADHVTFLKRNIQKDSREWDGNHLNQELTDLRNEMLSLTETDWVWQVDGDEIYLPGTIMQLSAALWGLEQLGNYRGIMVPIKWCVSDTGFVQPGPFHKTLRVFPGTGIWKGEFPNEFFWVDDQPMTINDSRCLPIHSHFLHMSMALHPERRPPNGKVIELSDEEKQCLSI